MNLDDFLAHVRTGAVIKGGSAQHAFMIETAAEMVLAASAPDGADLGGDLEGALPR